MDQAAVDALVYWAGAFFLGGFTVGCHREAVAREYELRGGDDRC